MTKKKNSNKYNKSWITWFNKNKSKDVYDRVLKEMIPEYKKCKYCDGPIYYYDSIFRLDRNYNLYVDKKSYLTSKELFGNKYYLSVCEECLTKKYPYYQELNKSRVFNRICEITCYAFDIPDDISKQWKKENYSITLKTLVQKHGTERGEEIWENYCKKQSESNKFEYKKEKYGWSEEQFKNYNKSRSVTLENILKRNGEEKGMKIWNNYIDRQRYTTTFQYFIEKYGDVDGKDKYDNFCKKRAMESGYSNMSQKIFDRIREKLNENYTYYYASYNHEYYLSFTGNKFYLLDFYIKELKLSIEFNGDMWHANPLIYKENDTPLPIKNDNTTAKQIWDSDKEKIKHIKTKINNVIIIWEKELNEKGIEKLTDELVEKIKSYK